MWLLRLNYFQLVYILSRAVYRFVIYENRLSVLHSTCGDINVSECGELADNHNNIGIILPDTARYCMTLPDTA